MRRHVNAVRTEVHLVVRLVHQIQFHARTVRQLFQHVGGFVQTLRQLRNVGQIEAEIVHLDGHDFDAGRRLSVRSK